MKKQEDVVIEVKHGVNNLRTLSDVYVIGEEEADEIVQPWIDASKVIIGPGEWFTEADICSFDSIFCLSEEELDELFGLQCYNPNATGVNTSYDESSVIVMG